MTTSKQSNVTRMLDARHIPYQAYTYSTDIRSAEDVAQVLEAPAHEVYKTLAVLPPRGKPLLVIIPGPRALGLKRLAQALGEKKLRMATRREAEELTGFRRGVFRPWPCWTAAFKSTSIGWRRPSRHLS